jgi:y4mF family transcriptional regulator
MEIGSCVREKRRALRLTQQQLADKAGVGLNFVYQLEKNKATVQLDCTKQVLAALGLELAIKDTGAFPDNSIPVQRSHPNPLPWDAEQ